MAKGLKDPCRHVAGVGGQYKMYNSLIFINFYSNEITPGGFFLDVVSRNLNFCSKERCTDQLGI